LIAKASKCSFDCVEIDFLGHFISPRGISMDPAKLEPIKTWAVPQDVHDIQVFLGFANYYRRFINKFADLSLPLTQLLRKNVVWRWGDRQQQAFDGLKSALLSAPVLRHFDPDLPIILDTDASDFALGAVLSQPDPSDGLEHPVAFLSRQFSPAQFNYDTHDKELLAIVSAFQEWRHYLIGATDPITVRSDHHNLRYFMTTKQLNRRQARWAQILSDFRFTIHHRPGAQHRNADSLSRRSELAPKEGDAHYTQLQQQLLQPHQIAAVSTRLNTLLIATTTSPALPAHIITKIRDALPSDPLAAKIIKALEEDPDDPSYEEYSWGKDLLFYNDLIFVPQSCYVDVLKLRHDTPLAGHFGFLKTLDLVSRDFFWPGMRKFIKDFVSSCDICQRIKPSRHAPYGLLQSLPTPAGRWTDVTMDFIVELPPSDGHDAICVGIDRLTKQAHFIPCNTNINAQQTAQLYVREFLRLHGVPKTITTDRGPQFLSRFWSRFFELLGSKSQLSSAYHPQTDGQSERTNSVLEQYLRAFCNYAQNDWVNLLPLAEFAYNNTKHASTGVSPFFANYGFHPSFDIIRPDSSVTPAAENFIEQMRQLEEELKIAIENAQQQQQQFANLHRLAPPAFKVGDQVMLNAKNIKTTRPSKKLDFKKLGPFKIVRQINPVAFKLELPPSFDIHDVFHVSLLEPYHANTIDNRTQPPPPPVEIEGESEFEVQEILDSRFYRRKLQYFVDWVGYGVAERSWQPVENLENAQEAIQEFHQKFPNKPGPQSSTSASNTRRRRRRRR
jgi:transposase InsO family protein